MGMMRRQEADHGSAGSAHRWFALTGPEGRKRILALPGKGEKEEIPVLPGRSLPAEPYTRGDGHLELSRRVGVIRIQHAGGGLRGDHDGPIDQNCDLVRRVGGRRGREGKPALRQR